MKLVNKGTYQVLTSEICEKGEIGMPPTLNCQVLANTVTSASFVRVCTVCVLFFCLDHLFFACTFVFLSFHPVLVMRSPGQLQLHL